MRGVGGGSGCGDGECVLVFYGCWVKSGQFGPVCQCKLTNRMTLKVPYTDVIAIEHDVGSPVYRPSCDRTWRWQSRIQTPLRWNTALAVPYTDLLAIEHGFGSPVYRPPCDRTWPCLKYFTITKRKERVSKCPVRKAFLAATSHCRAGMMRGSSDEFLFF